MKADHCQPEEETCITAPSREGERERGEIKGIIIRDKKGTRERRRRVRVHAEC